MKVLFLSWKSYGNSDMISAFSESGHIVIDFPFDDKDDTTDDNVIRYKCQIKQYNVDIVFSFNYFPVMAIVCHDLGIPYISWIYDNPYVRLYHYSTIFSTNHIFVFDSSIYLEFRRQGINTVHYLPMAANTDRLREMKDFDILHKSEWENRHEVSFVGSLYTEKHQFYQRMDGISDYTRGFIEGMIDSQKLVYGYNFVQNVLAKAPSIISDMQKSLPISTRKDGVESIEYLFAQYVINRQITAIERREILKNVAINFGLDLYTPNRAVEFEGCTNHGPVDYYDMAPYVFKKTKINLNITLRSIISGIPLRAFDIMGAGGFLLSNYQSDFLKHFVPDEDFVFYESKDDLIAKIDYYLTHEDERIQIAKNGFEKIKEKHTYRHRVQEMISYLN